MGYSEAATLGEQNADSEAPTGVPTGRSLLGGSVQPEASGGPSGASTLRRVGSYEVPSRPIWQSQHVASMPDLALSGGAFAAPRASPGRSSSTAALASTYASSGYPSSSPV